MPQPQLRYVGIIYSRSFVNTSKHSMQPSHRHYRPSSKDNEVFPSRNSDPDLSRLDRSRNSGHGPGYVYVDKFSRDDPIKVDSPYPSRGPYEEPMRPQDLANRTSSHNDAISRGPIPPSSLPRLRESMNAAPATSTVLVSTIVEKPHRRSRDRSPRHHRESPRSQLTLLIRTRARTSTSLNPLSVSALPNAASLHTLSPASSPTTTDFPPTGHIRNYQHLLPRQHSFPHNHTHSHVPYGTSPSPVPMDFEDAQDRKWQRTAHAVGDRGKGH